MNGRGKTKPYTMDDYIKDREQSWGKTETGSPMQAPKSSTGGFTVSKFTPPLPLGAISLQKQAMERRNQAAGTVTAPSVEAPSVNVGSGAPEGGTLGAVPLTDVDVYKYQMDQARQKVYDVLNRKFKYNAKDSPLYTIMQQQYEREAERAAGRAYSSAVANTGGYGSSYATLAGEEARRQVMEGMDEAQYELYQAARQEFMDERQSAVDWYSQARQMYLDKLSDEEYRKQLEAEAGKTMSDSTYKLLIEASENGWYKEDNENLLHAKLETYAAGDPSIDVDTIMGHLRREHEAWQADTEAMTENGVEADPERVQTFYGAAYEVWDGTNEETVRTALKNQGATEEEAATVISKLKDDTRAVIADEVKQYELMPTLSGAAMIMGEAKQAGIEGEFVGQISSSLSESFISTIKDYSKAGVYLGVNAAAWDELDDDTKGVEIINTAGEAFREGMLTEDDFTSVLMESVKKDFADPKIRITDALANVNGILLLRDQGVITEDMALHILDEIAQIPAARKAAREVEKDLNYSTILTIMTKAEEDAYKALTEAIKRVE